jgi:hypothetical protein
MGAPKRVKIDGYWYDVCSGWGSNLDLRGCMDAEKGYTIREPYMHISDLYYVYKNGSSVGEISMTNGTYSGCVQEFE